VARLIFVLGVLVSVVGIILYSVDLYKHGHDKRFIGFFSSAGFVILTIPISLRLIISHLMNWVQPQIQKYVVRIIWMVPIYAVESWFALRFKGFSIYLEVLRECYEAYAIYCFLYFLFALLGGDEVVIVQKLKEKASTLGQHAWPVGIAVSPWIMGQDFLQKCKVKRYSLLIAVVRLVALMVSIAFALVLFDK
jgi:hypothetical protein